VKQERLVYPTERLVGVVDGPDAVDGVVDALQEANVGEEDIEVVGAESDEHQIDPSDHGWAKRAKHVLTTALGDETERLEALQDALEAGRYIVQVRLPSEDDDQREDDKKRLGRVLSGAGAQHVAFYGKWQIEEIQLGA
jgi:hypothetical protein